MCGIMCGIMLSVVRRNACSVRTLDALDHTEVVERRALRRLCREMPTTCSASVGRYGAFMCGIMCGIMLSVVRRNACSIRTLDALDHTEAVERRGIQRLSFSRIGSLVISEMTFTRGRVLPRSFANLILQQREHTWRCECRRQLHGTRSYCMQSTHLPLVPGGR